MSNYQTPPSRTLVNPSRPHDFLYDPNYIMPSREDFLKDAERGTKAGAQLKLKPVYENFFSDIITQPRIEPCLTIPMPSNLDGYVPQYVIDGVPVMPMDTGPLPLPRQVDDVTGADRAKYGIKYGEPIYYMQREAFDFNKLSPEEKKKILQTEKTQRSGFISRGMQTDTRESETQTDPYSPPYKLPHPGSYPKVLALMKLTWAKGLPFTLEDIVVIERALSRRILDHTERISEDQEGFETRIKLMEELEAQQWADREKELEKVLQFKMEITSKLLQEYSTKMATDHTMRLERLQAILRSRNAKHLENVKHQYFRNLRKLEKKYIDPKPPTKRNIIKDYTEFDSKVYAPLVRNGTSIDQLNPAPHFHFDLHRNFEEFQELTNSEVFIRKEIYFDMDAFKERIKKCEPNAQDQRLERKLEKVYNTFKDWTLPKKINPFDLLDPPTDDLGRMSAPLIALDGDDEGRQRRPHCITLQKIARGRVIQRMIRDDLEQNMNELVGLKYMFDMDPNCQRLEEGQMQKLLSMKKQSEAESTKDTEVKEVLGHLEGESLNKMLDFLDKEMIRLIDERKVHALILLAERERRRKEAAEGGRRFMEEENKRSQDEMFRQIVGIHQSTIDIYLEDMFIEACDRVADEESRNLVRQMAATLNEAAYSLPSELGEFEKEEMAAELVSSYIIPELSRLMHQEKVDASQSRYRKASAQVMDAVFGAHGLLKQIVDVPLPIIVQEYDIIGDSAVDGSLTAVDEMIKGAAAKVIKAEEDAAAAAAAAASTSAEPVVEKVESVEPGEDEDEEIEEIEVPEYMVPENAQVEFGPGEPAQMKDEAVEAVEEVPEEDFFEDPTIFARANLRKKLAAKALQIELDIEPSERLEAMYYGLKGAVDDIITAAQRVVAPDPPKQEEIENPVEEDTDDD